MWERGDGLIRWQGNGVGEECGGGGGIRDAGGGGSQDVGLCAGGRGDCFEGRGPEMRAGTDPPYSMIEAAGEHQRRSACRNQRNLCKKRLDRGVSRTKLCAVSRVCGWRAQKKSKERGFNRRGEF